MSSMPRLAVGALHAGGDSRAMLWGLIDALDRDGLRIQTFLSRSCVACMDGTSTITGVRPWHLDSWLMSAPQCQQTFLRATRHADLAIVEGNLSGATADQPGGQMEPLCNWLGLPRLGILDVRELSACRMPIRCPSAEALLLDGVSGSADFYRWQTVVESLCGLPVVGALEQVSVAREIISRLEPGQKPARELCRALGESLLRYTDPEAILELSQSAALPRRGSSECSACASDPHTAAQEFLEDVLPAAHEGLTVAVAYDEVFSGYFPDALDALEQRGVTVRDFSPLRDEALPADCDIVYIGCGFPARHAMELSANHCLLAAIREHVCAGKRIYAEGGGLAYLCQHLALANGRRIPLAGVFPAVAHLSPQLRWPTPIELTLAGDNWLGKANQRVRGYLNDNWRLEPTGPLSGCTSDGSRRYDMVERHQAIGSRVHLNLAAQPKLLESFLQPCPAALTWAAAR